jgi:uncharacterized protein YukE
MTDLTPNDVRRWDAEAVLKVFQVANARGQTLHQFGEDLGQTGQLLAEWHGEAGSAFHSNLGRLRTDIESDGHESRQVAGAVGTAWEDVQICKGMMSKVDATAETLGCTVTEDWKVNPSDLAALLIGPREAELQRQTLQTDLDTVKIKAHTTDHELATAMRTAVGDAQLDSDGGSGAYSPPPKQSGEQPAKDGKAQSAETDGGAAQLPSTPTPANGQPPQEINTRIGNTGDGIDKAAATAGEYAAVPQRSAGLGPTQGQLNRAAVRAPESLESLSGVGKRLGWLGYGMEVANGFKEGSKEVEEGKTIGEAVVNVAPKTVGSVAGGFAGAAAGAEYGAGLGAGLGAAIGTVVPGAGTAVGAAVGAGVGAVAGGIAGSEIGKDMGKAITNGLHALFDD